MQLLRKDSYPVPPIFDLLAKEGQIEEQMMYNTFNMGLGMVLAIDPAEIEKALEHFERSSRVCICRWKDRSRRKGSDLMLRVVSAVFPAAEPTSRRSWMRWTNGTITNAEAGWGSSATSPRPMRLERAKTHGIPAVCVSRKAFGTKEAFKQEILERRLMDLRRGSDRSGRLPGGDCRKNSSRNTRTVSSTSIHP